MMNPALKAELSRVDNEMRNIHQQMDKLLAQVQPVEVQSELKLLLAEYDARNVRLLKEVKRNGK